MFTILRDVGDDLVKLGSQGLKECLALLMLPL